MQRLEPQSLAGSTLVLLLSEAANVIEPNADNRQTLEQVASGLDQPGVPRALRLRAALDLAGLYERTAQRERALQLLRKLVSTGATPPGAATLLDSLVSSTLVLLDDGIHSPTERLGAFRDVFRSGDYPPSVQTWKLRWESELEYRAAKGRCAKNARCEKREAARRDDSLAAIAAKTPPVTARLLARGVLTLGALEMSIDYHPGAGLKPLVRTDTLLLSLPMPATG